MTNREKYEKEILDVFWKDSIHPAVTKNGIESCDGISCGDCLFSWRQNYTGDCEKTFREWLGEEYKDSEIDWTKVPADTKILVKHCKEDPWERRHFCSCWGGVIWAFPDGKTSWTSDTFNAPSSTYTWKFADIADPEERKKYLKYDL